MEYKTLRLIRLNSVMRLNRLVSTLLILISWGLNGQEYQLTWEDFLPLWMESKSQDSSRVLLDHQRDDLIRKQKFNPQVSVSSPLEVRMAGFASFNPGSDSTGDSNTQQFGALEPSSSWTLVGTGGLRLGVDSLGVSGSIGGGLEARWDKVPLLNYRERRVIPQLFGTLTIPTNWNTTRLTSTLVQLDLSLLEYQSMEVTRNQQIQGITWFTQVGLLQNQVYWVDRNIPIMKRLVEVQQTAINTGNVIPWESFELNKELLSLYHQRSILDQELQGFRWYLRIHVPTPIPLSRFPVVAPWIADSVLDTSSNKTMVVNQRLPGIDKASTELWALQRQRIEMTEQVRKAQTAPEIRVSVQAQIQQGQISWSGTVGIQPRKVFGEEKERQTTVNQERERLMVDQREKEREIRLEQNRITVALAEQIQWIGRIEQWIRQVEGLLDQFARAKEAKSIDELAYYKGKLELYQYQAALDQARWEVWRLQMTNKVMGWE